MSEAPSRPIMLVSSGELALRLNLHPRTILKWARRGMLPKVQLSPTCVRFNLEECTAIIRHSGAPISEDTGSFIVNKSGAIQKKPVFLKRFTVTVHACQLKNRPNIKWVVYINHPWKPLERHYFKTKQQAESEANARRIEAENFGLNAMALTQAQRFEALAALDLIRPFNVTLTEVVREFIDRRKGTQATFAEVAEQYLESRRGLGRSQRHLSTVKNVMARAGKALGDRRMSDISGTDLQAWIGSIEVGPVSRNHLRTLLHGVFEFAKRRKIISDNPAKDVERHRVSVNKVGILTPDEMTTLLTGAKENPDVMVSLAIGGFAGLRPEEIKRLKWSAIDLERGLIDCGSEITKTAQHRYVKIEPVLAAWLKTDARLAESLSAGNWIQGENFRRRYDAVRKAAGFAVRGEEGKPWPHDALRHSFGSYHPAHFKNAANTALEMGHEGTKMLFQNYRSRVADSVAATWWALFPKSEGQS